MQFDFPPSLVARLAQIAHDHGDPTRVSVIGSMDRMCYLTSDGRVFMENEDHPLHHTDDPFFVYSTLIRAAERFDLPELRTFLPRCPRTGIPCPTCQGTHYMAFGSLRLFCHPCQARGWIEATDH